MHNNHPSYPQSPKLPAWGSSNRPPSQEPHYRELQCKLYWPQSYPAVELGVSVSCYMKTAENGRKTNHQMTFTNGKILRGLCLCCTLKSDFFFSRHTTQWYMRSESYRFVWISTTEVRAVSFGSRVLCPCICWLELLPWKTVVFFPIKLVGLLLNSQLLWILLH